MFIFYFTMQELSMFQSDYFANYSFKNESIEVQSKNTGHWWKLEKKELPICNKVVLYHKYNKKDKYHKQCHVDLVVIAFYRILGHDKYILAKKKKNPVK